MQDGDDSYLWLEALDTPDVMRWVSERNAETLAALVDDRAHYYENVEGGHGAAADNEQAAVISALVLEFLWRQLSDSPG